MIPGFNSPQSISITPGSQTFSVPGTYSFQVPRFSTLTAACSPGSPGSPGVGGNGSNYSHGYNAGQPGSPGGGSSFNGAGSTTYQRGQSLSPFVTVTVVVGSGGAGGLGGFTYDPSYNTNGNAPSGAPGSPGSVSVSWS